MFLFIESFILNIKNLYFLISAGLWLFLKFLYGFKFYIVFYYAFFCQDLLYR